MKVGETSHLQYKQIYFINLKIFTVHKKHRYVI